MSAVVFTQNYLGLIFSGQLDQALDLTAADARFIGTCPEASTANPLFGTFVGPQGARDFFGAFSEVIEPGEFVVDGQFGAEDSACLYGHFKHKVRATGLPFKSDWALVAKVQDGKLALYHFYEDTAALADAMRPA